jgi:hypothetical protein
LPIFRWQNDEEELHFACKKMVQKNVSPAKNQAESSSNCGKAKEICEM